MRKKFKSSESENAFITLEVIKLRFDTPQSLENTGFFKTAP